MQNYGIYSCICHFFYVSLRTFCAHNMKLSIITINRNNAAGLRKTMESVYSQTYRDFEYIVVDGASTDESVDVIKELTNERVNELTNFKWISEPDTGIYNAMNKGIRMSHGEYCLFLNSGDFLIARDVLTRVFEEKLEADIINARCNVSDNGNVVWCSPYIPKVTLKDIYFVGLPHQSTFIKRTLFDKYGMYREDFRYNSDIDFWYKTVVLGEATTQGLNIIATDYNLDGLSSKESESELYKAEITEILSQGYLPKILPDYELWQKERQVVSKYGWIEMHKGLQKILLWYRKLCKYISK